jgi:Protein of unknown function (DUF2889)
VTTRWPGDIGALEATPLRRAGSVRRTMTIDGHRPGGAFGDVVIDGRGRDLVTPFAGGARIDATERLHLQADFVSNQVVEEIDAQPGDPGLGSLVGLPSRRGFRAATAARMPHRADDGSLLVAMLNDVPIVTSLSRIALRRRRAISFRSSDPNFLGNRGTAGAAWTADRVECAGWAPGTTMSRRAAAGLDPTVGDSAESPPILREGDNLAWHVVPSLPADGFRRWRRIDLWRSDADPSLIDVDGWWRDTYVAEDGTLRIVHEYSVNLTVDGRSLVVVASGAEPRVLPAPECNRAAATAARLVGRRLDALGPMVREELSGFSTCTHLNDEIRCLGDVARLVPLIPPR